MSGFHGFKLAQRDLIRGGRVDTSRLTCRAYRSGEGSPLCAQRAAWLLTSACAHEHVVPSLACDEHAANARRIQERGAVTCKPCTQGHQPHKCAVMIEFDALPGGGQ